MRRKDFRFMHDLLLTIRADLRDRGEEIETPNYNTLNVVPKPIHSKAEQKQAVFTILNDICTELEATETDVSDSMSEKTPATAD